MNIKLATNIEDLSDKIEYKTHYLNILGEVVVVIDVCDTDGYCSEKAVILDKDNRNQIVDPGSN